MMDITQTASTAIITGLVTSIYGLIAWAIKSSYNAKRDARESLESNRELMLESLAVIFTTLIELQYDSLASKASITPTQHRRWSYLYSSYVALNGDDVHINRLDEIIATKAVGES